MAHEKVVRSSVNVNESFVERIATIVILHFKIHFVFIEGQ
jgi:hypothetical protein